MSKEMGRCYIKECSRKVEFVSPQDLCRKHWLDWWCEEVENDSEISQKEKTLFRKEADDVLEKNFNGKLKQ